HLTGTRAAAARCTRSPHETKVLITRGNFPVIGGIIPAPRGWTAKAAYEACHAGFDASRAVSRFVRLPQGEQGRDVGSTAPPVAIRAGQPAIAGFLVFR